MANEKCPGQYARYPIDIVKEYPCPSCGELNELFYDEIQKDCYKCKSPITKEPIELLKSLGCGVSCKAAEGCLGPKVYLALEKAKSDLTQKRESQLEGLLKIIPDEDSEAREFFINAVGTNPDITILINPLTTIGPLKKSKPELHSRVAGYYQNFIKNNY